jgi:hypothetical protein
VKITETLSSISCGYFDNSANTTFQANLMPYSDSA